MVADLRFAFRALARSPVFTSVSVVMLAAGIGLAIFMFGAINIYALKPLPFAKPDQLVSIQYTDSETGRRNLSIPLIDWLDLHARQQSLQSLQAYSVGTMNLGGIDARYRRFVAGERPNPLIDTGACRAYVDRAEQRLAARLDRESATSAPPGS